MGNHVWNRCIYHFISILRWIPIAFISVIVVWAYYGYVYEFCLGIVNEIGLKILYLIGFHIFMTMFLWSYFQTVISKIGTPPFQFFIPQAWRNILEALWAPESESEFRTSLENFVREQKIILINVNRLPEGGPRFCVKCYCIKPDRCHHCSVCGKCILKFDHHCPWVNTCINFRNYKFFILFLGYGSLLCSFGFFTILPYFIYFWQANKFGQATFGTFNVLFLFFISGLFGISMGCLFFYHVFLTAKNMTTLETFQSPLFSYGVDKRGFNLGIKRNFQQVFGLNPWLWAVPVFTSLGDGWTYAHNSRLLGADNTSVNAFENYHLRSRAPEVA